MTGKRYIFSKKRKKIYTGEVKGKFRRAKTAIAIIGLGIFYVLPWIRYGDHTSIMIDIPERKFHIFGAVFVPQDLLMLTFILFTLAILLFAITAAIGRVFCGFFCPQTVWRDLFQYIEKIIEGKREQRKRLDRLPNSNPKKLGKKLLKNLIYLAVGLFTGFTFVSYFSTPDGAYTLFWRIVHLRLLPTEIVAILVVAAFNIIFQGYAREQVCIFMCPYARFQGAMYDKDTYVIGYDTERGEGKTGRGIFKRDHKPPGHGDCVDCGECVRVCPQGIDIREGTQYQCITCGLCIDACNRVMEKMHLSHGLIRYDSENHLVFDKKTRLIRARVIIYLVLLIAAVVAINVYISTRSMLQIDAIHARRIPYRITSDGSIYNFFTLKLFNKDKTTHIYRVSVSGLKGAVVKYSINPVKIPPHSMMTIYAKVFLKPSMFHEDEKFYFVMSAVDKKQMQSKSKAAEFLGPENES